MITMWIFLGVVAAVTLFWRVRTASSKLDRILRDEVDESESEPLPASHNR